MKEITLAVSSEGRITAIYDDELAELCREGTATIIRASYVEPVEGGEWMADMSPICNKANVNAELLGPFTLRSEALNAEVEWLKRRMFGVEMDPRS